ncbi:DUF1080 domain-containing protein [Akkermansiaceae bacterium]|nr:DUF1080 domain-containing protein [Akkermansiaceae bacterium]
MKKQTLAVLGGAFITAGGLHAQGLGYQDTPIIPGTKYHVHDGERPQPRIIDTAGAVVVKPPSDAKVLFDGSNLDAWASRKGEPTWEIRDGAMVAKGSDIFTKEEFGAVQLHFEWKIPAGRKVSGQGGGNSGCFLMGKYEVQILQSHGNKTYPDGQAAALYGIQPPIVNATSPQGEWNSYDITFEPPVYEDGKLKTPAMVTVIHNGIMVQHREAYSGPSGHKTLASYPAEHPATGPIRLQFHGDPVEFRNFWVRPLGVRDQEE